LRSIGARYSRRRGLFDRSVGGHCVFTKMEWICIIQACLFLLALLSSLSIALWIFHVIASLFVSSSLLKGALSFCLALSVGGATYVALEHSFRGVLRICNITLPDKSQMY
jgi:uncharacterized membrane-anchored protein